MLAHKGRVIIYNCGHRDVVGYQLLGSLRIFVAIPADTYHWLHGYKRCCSLRFCGYAPLSRLENFQENL
jgi:hypothetical protein